MIKEDDLPKELEETPILASSKRALTKEVGMLAKITPLTYATMTKRRVATAITMPEVA